MSPKSPLILTSPSLTRKFVQNQRDRNRKMTRAQAAKLQAVMTKSHTQAPEKDSITPVANAESFDETSKLARKVEK